MVQPDFSVLPTNYISTDVWVSLGKADAPLHPKHCIIAEHTLQSLTSLPSQSYSHLDDIHAIKFNPVLFIITTTQAFPHLWKLLSC